MYLGMMLDLKLHRKLSAPCTTRRPRAGSIRFGGCLLQGQTPTLAARRATRLFMSLHWPIADNYVDTWASAASNMYRPSPTVDCILMESALAELLRTWCHVVLSGNLWGYLVLSGTMRCYRMLCAQLVSQGKLH